MRKRREEGVSVLIAFQASDELIRDVTGVSLKRIREIRKQTEQERHEREQPPSSEKTPLCYH